MQNIATESSKILSAESTDGSSFHGSGHQACLNKMSHLVRLWHFLSSVNAFVQMRMLSYPVGLDVWFLVGSFVYFHTSCVRTDKALSRLRGCAGSPEPSLVAYVISTIISWAGSNIKHSPISCDAIHIVSSHLITTLFIFPVKCLLHLFFPPKPPGRASLVAVLLHDCNYTVAHFMELLYKYLIV